MRGIILAFAVGLIILIKNANAIPVEEELKITERERTALIKFKQLVGPRLTKDYMQNDLYLIRWLRAANLDIRGAERRFNDNLKWREESNMDNILNEDFEDMEGDYPYSTDTHDKEGRPIVSFSLGDWDLRKGILQGKRDRVLRWLDRGFEEAAQQIREKQSRGENVTQAIFLINLKNFNIVQQGCFQCLPAIYQYFQHQVYYPNMADKIILIDTPALFEAVLQLLNPIVAPETRVALKVFGPDRMKWTNYLYSLIDRNQLYPEFGGTRSH